MSIYLVQNSFQYQTTRMEHHCKDNDWQQCDSYCVDKAYTATGNEYSFVEAVSSDTARESARSTLGFNNVFGIVLLTTKLKVEDCRKAIEGMLCIVVKIEKLQHNISKAQEEVRYIDNIMYNAKEKGISEYVNIAKVTADRTKAKAKLDLLKQELKPFVDETDSIRKEIFGCINFSCDGAFQGKTLAEREAIAKETKRRLEYEEFLRLKAQFEK